MNEDNLIKYYNKFNEDKRLNSRHGLVEFKTTVKYIEDFVKDGDSIIEVGAGCGRYSIYFAEKGFNVTAVELVKHNLKVIEKKSSKVKTYLGNAIDLSVFPDNSFDVVLLLGPLYHLITEKEKLQALMEAKRILKDDGIIFVAYCMSEYAIIKHGFIDHNILNEMNRIDDDFNVTSTPSDLYSYVRLEDIDVLNEKAGLKRIKIITPDGPANYLRRTLNEMSNEEFEKFLDYNFKTCERYDLLGAAFHTLDIVKKM